MHLVLFRHLSFLMVFVSWVAEGRFLKKRGGGMRSRSNGRAGATQSDGGHNCNSTDDDGDSRIALVVVFVIVPFSIVALLLFYCYIWCKHRQTEGAESKKNRSPETAHQEGERQEAEKDHGIATAPEAFASTMTPQGFPIMSISPNSPRQDDNASRIATTAVTRLAGPTKDSS